MDSGALGRGVVAPDRVAQREGAFRIRGVENEEQAVRRFLERGVDAYVPGIERDRARLWKDGDLSGG